jgi:AsmA protein
MLKKVLLGAFLLVTLLVIALSLWVRAVFTEDTVRTALAEQLSKALGQPVTIGSIGATIYPRVTVNLGQVKIGAPPAIQVQTLHVGADFRALLSRRIEHARLELAGAHVELPLPIFSIGSSSTSGSSSTPAVELVSVDAIVLRGVDIVSGGRKLTGDVELVPEGKGLTLQKVTLLADKATVSVTGKITDLSGPVGDVTIKAGALSFDDLLAFVNDFSAGAGMAQRTAASSGTQRPTSPSTASAGAPPMNLTFSVGADRATMGMLTLDKLAGKGRITADAMTLDPISFGVFGGRYDGALAFALAAVPDFKLNAGLTGIDVAAATAFAGSPGTITGRLSGKLTIAGRGMDAASVMKSAHGTARVDIVNGVVKDLGLIRTIVLATSGRSDNAATGEKTTKDEPFTKLGATLTIANGSASTEDLRFESKDLVLATTGAVQLDGRAINLKGQVQLSDELSKQAGRDLVRYTQEGGRVTLPATITGSANAPQVRIDVASMARRALTNRASEEAGKALKKGLGGLFKK